MPRSVRKAAAKRKWPDPMPLDAPFIASTPAPWLRAAALFSSIMPAKLER